MLRRAPSRKPLWLVTAAQTLGRLRLCSHFADEAAAATAATAAAAAAADADATAAAAAAADSGPTVSYAARRAARRHVQGKVLDRPNPNPPNP